MSEADVCEECAEKCLLIHKRNRDPSSIVSSFFKIIIDDRFLRFLPVPPRFAPRLASLMDQETRVEDSSGREWAVTLSTVNGRLGFEKGWNAFSLDHGIKLGDLLIFYYILDSHFVVQIYGRSGCEKLTLPSENNTVHNKRIRTTADGPSNRSDKDSGLCLATNPSNKGNLEEPYLMMVDRDARIAREEERIPLFDMFASEIGNIKAVAKVDNVQKGNGSSNAEDIVDNHNNAVEDVLKDRIDATDTRERNGDLEMNIMQLESAMGLEFPEQLHKGSSNNNILDYDTAFDDLLEDALNVKMSKINEKGKNDYQWSSGIDHKSNIATKSENGIWKTNSKDLPSSVLNVIEQNSKEVHISSGRRVDEPKSAFGVNRSMDKHSYQEVSCSVAAIPVSESNGQSVKVVKTVHKEINQELDVGSEQESNITAHENLNAATNAGEVHQTVNTEPVDHTPLQVSCTVTPNSKFFLEIPKGLPIGRAEVEEMVVILRDSVGRRWPVLYHEKNGLNALVYGWKSFSRVNGIRSGDKCVFTLEDQYEPLCRVQIIHK